MKIVGETHQGLVRSSNQDSFAFGDFSSESCWAVVCDGMGGANGGNIASQSAVKIAAENLCLHFREEMTDNSIKNLLQTVAAQANYSVYSKAQVDDALSGMGTTIAAVVVSHKKAHIVHIGDSRVYLISGGEINQITKDHSIVQMMLDNGQITPEQAKEHPRKHIITRAIGVEETVQPDYDEVDLSPESILLLCTDGLTNFVEDDEILTLINQSGFEGVAVQLIELANQNGGGDNITVVAIACNS